MIRTRGANVELFGVFFFLFNFFFPTLSFSASFALEIETIFTSVAQALVRMSLSFSWLSTLASNSISFSIGASSSRLRTIFTPYCLLVVVDRADFQGASKQAVSRASEAASDGKPRRERCVSNRRVGPSKLGRVGKIKVGAKVEE